MDKKIASNITGGNTAYKRVKSDYYPTPPEATQALLNFLHLPMETVIWEPACGEGYMADVIEQNGYQLICSDISTGVNYLTTNFCKCDWIITNPPFSQSQEFIARSIEFNVPFAFLLKSQYWHAKKTLRSFFTISASVHFTINLASGFSFWS